MNNLNLSISCVDGSQLPLDYDSGKELIGELFGDDWGAPPKFLSISATAADGKYVRIDIPYSTTADVQVTIE